MAQTLHFRLDDDDAICAEMISLLRCSTPPARHHELVTFPRGLYLTYHDGRPYLLRRFEPYVAIAWVFVNEPRQIRNPYQGAHGTHCKNLPSMMNALPYAYLHVAHGARMVGATGKSLCATSKSSVRNAVYSSETMSLRLMLISRSCVRQTFCSAAHCFVLQFAALDCGPSATGTCQVDANS